MISNHTALIGALRPQAELLASQIERFLAAGGTIFEAPAPTYSPRPALPVAQRNEAEERQYQSARQAAAEKQAFADKVREMAKTMTQKDIVEATGVHRKVLFALGQKHGFTFKFGRTSKPNTTGPRIDRTQDAARVERILAFKELGLTRAQATRKLDVSGKLFLRLIDDYDIDYPKVSVAAK
jgi:hypothetical protein